MKMNINSLLPQNGNANQNAAAVALERKWEKTGLLEGMSNEVERKGMAVLLENQAKQLVSEANATNTSANGEEWAGVALPLVRRIFAEIAAKDFVSVQPMNLPSGLIFYLDFKYGTAQGQLDSAGGNDFLTGAGRTSQADSVFGITEGADAGTEGLYGPGRFGYTINDVKVEGIAALSGSITNANAFTDAGTAGGNARMSQTAFNIFTNFNSEFSASQIDVAGGHFVIQVGSGSIPGYDTEAVRAFNLETPGCTIYPEFTRATANGSHVEFLVSGAPTKPADTNVAYHKQPTDISRGDFEDKDPGHYSSEADKALDIPEINLEMRSEAIVAKTRKLKAVWFPEFA